MGSFNGEDMLISFGGYNGHYNNEVETVLASLRLGSFCFYLIFYVLLPG